MPSARDLRVGIPSNLNLPQGPKSEEYVVLNEVYICKDYQGILLVIIQVSKAEQI